MSKPPTRSAPWNSANARGGSLIHGSARLLHTRSKRALANGSRQRSPQTRATEPCAPPRVPSQRAKIERSVPALAAARRHQHARSDIHADDRCGRKSRSQFTDRVAAAAAGIENRGRLKLDEGEAL